MQENCENIFMFWGNTIIFNLIVTFETVYGVTLCRAPSITIGLLIGV